MSAPRELSLRDCGAQLGGGCLQPHLQKFSMATKEENAISQDMVRKSFCTEKGAQGRNGCIRAGRFGPVGRRGVLKYQSVEYPSAGVLEGMARGRGMPQVVGCGVVKSRAKSGLIKWLLEEIKNPNTPDPRFGGLGDQVYARVCGPGFGPIE